MGHTKGVECPWLTPKRRRRTIQNDVVRYLTPQEILELIETREWPYKGGQYSDREYGKSRLHARDKAFMALMFLTSGRVNEVLRLTKDQFKEMAEITSYVEPDSDILMCSQFWVSKRRKGSRHPIIDLPLPRVGTFAPFTALVEQYLAYLKPQEKLFKFGRARAWVIVNFITDKWNHFFRAQSLSFLVNRLGSAMRVARERGIENVQTITHYYRGEWLVDKEALKK